MAKLYAKAPDGSDALLSIVITGFTQSLQQNGWCKLPNGLLFQWGRPWLNGNNTLPLSYINFVIIVTGGDYSYEHRDSHVDYIDLTYFEAARWTDEFPSSWITLGI